MPVFAYDGGEPDCALNAMFKRGRGIFRLDFVDKLPIMHGGRPQNRLVLRQDQAGQNHQGNQAEKFSQEPATPSPPAPRNTRATDAPLRAPQSSINLPATPGEPAQRCRSDESA